MRLTDRLPTSVHGHAVYTDFRDWLRFEKMIRDNDLTEQEKTILMLDWYKTSAGTDMEQALDGLVWFYMCGDTGPQGTGDAVSDSRPQQVYDYDSDATMIYAAFRQAYGINLSTARLHWWEFRALLEHVPEGTRLAQVISIRSMDTSAMKGEERKHYEKLKRLCAIGAEPEYKPKTLKERDEDILKRIAKRGVAAGGV